MKIIKTHDALHGYFVIQLSISDTHGTTKCTIVLRLITVVVWFLTYRVLFVILEHFFKLSIFGNVMKAGTEKCQFVFIYLISNSYSSTQEKKKKKKTKKTTKENTRTQKLQ